MEVKEVLENETPIQIEAGNWRAKCSRPKCKRIIVEGKFIVKQGDFILCQMKVCFKCRIEQPIPIMYQTQQAAQNAGRRLQTCGIKTDQILVIQEELNLES